VEAERPLALVMKIDWDGGLRLQVRDSGPGIAAAAGEKGRPGTGLSLHSTMMAVIGGTLTVRSDPGVSTLVELALPEGPMGNYQAEE
jgi:signal transduction histidine kinase